VQFKTYHAYTMAEALAAVKRDLGSDAVILRTRTFKRGGILGFRRKTVVEVVAMPGDAAQSARHRQFNRAESSSPQESLRRSAPRAARQAYQQTAAGGKAGLDAPADDAHAGSPAPAVQANTQDGSAVNRRSRASAAHLSDEASASPTSSGNDSQVNDSHVDHAPDQQTHVAQAASADPSSLTNGALRCSARASTVESKPNAHPHPESAWKTPRRFILQPADLESPPATSGVADHAQTSSDSDDATTRHRSPRTHEPVEVLAAHASTPTSPRTTDSGASSNMTREMHDELSAIRTMVGHVLQRQTIASSGKPTPTMPQQLFDMYLQLIGQDVSEELADRVVNDVREELSVRELENQQRVREAIMRHLADYIPVADPGYAGVDEHRSDDRPLTIALIGPTGVGKTTTLAKLAASFKLRHQQKVGLITADTYRIAAVDQLRTYANIIGLPLEVVLKPSEMTRAMHALSDCDVILIDSAGRSQNDASRLQELKQFIDAADPHEVHLVLSGTASERVLLREAEAFSDVGVDKIVLTKLDEAVSFGVLVNVIRQVGKQLSFVTTGQEVPDHIEVGRAERLAELVLGNEVCNT